MVKSIKTVKGDILPIKDHVLVSDMEFAQLVTEGGIIIPGDEGSSRGIHPRWGKVYSVGPEQTEIKKGEWILVDHGRWTRGVTLVTDDGEELQVRRVDIKDILGKQDTKPNAVYQSGVYSGNAEQVDTLGRLDKD
jgi:co-chaperonin GroES (HSP10)|tara:strand:+ start:354 stop:758 length:405 start_codon:yes stop_codon:yes gene_type:complete